MNRVTTRGGGGLLSLAQPVEGEESWTTPARARERNFWPNLHARPVPPLSRRDSGFQGCRIGFGYLNCIGIDVDAHGFRRGVINQHLLIRTRVQGGLQPFLFPAKLHPILYTSTRPPVPDSAAEPAFSSFSLFLPSPSFFTRKTASTRVNRASPFLSFFPSNSFFLFEPRIFSR